MRENHALIVTHIVLAVFFKCKHVIYTIKLRKTKSQIILMSTEKHSEIINHVENVGGWSIKSESVTNALIFIYESTLRTKYACMRVVAAARHGRKKKKNRELLIITAVLCQYVDIIAVSAYSCTHFIIQYVIYIITYTAISMYRVRVV